MRTRSSPSFPVIFDYYDSRWHIPGSYTDTEYTIRFSLYQTTSDIQDRFIGRFSNLETGISLTAMYASEETRRKYAPLISFLKNEKRKE